MGTFMQDWLVGRAMSAPRGGGSNVIYELYNHTCDGTADTAINTGLKLFNATAYPNGWTIELEFYFTAHVSQGVVIRCRNSASPYNGIHVRNTNTTSGKAQTQVNSNDIDIMYSMNDRISVTFDYTPPTCVVTARNITASGATSSNSDSMSGKTVNVPLVIGGENTSDSDNFTWKPGRFSKCVIVSLVVTSK